MQGFRLWNTHKLYACRHPDGAGDDYNPGLGLKTIQNNLHLEDFLSTLFVSALFSRYCKQFTIETSSYNDHNVLITGFIFEHFFNIFASEHII